MWFENDNSSFKKRYAISKKELFINYDDDNGYYGESLIKRGLYPFDNKYFLKQFKNRNDLLSKFNIYLKKGDLYDCTYFSRRSRINMCPVILIQVINGEINIRTINDKFILKKNNKIYIFSNLYPKLIANSDTKIRLSIFDEIAMK